MWISHSTSYFWLPFQRIPNMQFCVLFYSWNRERPSMISRWFFVPFLVFLLIDSVLFYYRLAKMLPEPCFFLYYFCWICFFYLFRRIHFLSQNYSSLSSLIISYYYKLLPFFPFFCDCVESCWFGLLKNKLTKNKRRFVTLFLLAAMTVEGKQNSPIYFGVFNCFFFSCV